MRHPRQREPRVVFGFHAVLARLRADPKSVLEIYLDETRNDARGRDLASLAERAGVRVMRVPTKRLDGFYGGGRHQGVVARISIENVSDNLSDLLEKTEKPLLLVLDGITDPHNLGACLRVANAAGAHAVIAPRDRAAGINPTVSKVASGAAESTPYLMVTNLARALEEIKEKNVWVIGLDPSASQDIFSVKELPTSIAWVLGAEGEGMRRLTRETCDLLVRVPMQGQVESLNVSVAAGICLFESVRRRSPAPSAGRLARSS
ncbi:MAG: 23S rRNA (guanosine(2251)-2'-O)-methyltransferase RlmB [Pseudomonadota bacterium]